MIAGLEQIWRPEKRSATALGRLIATIACGGANGGRVHWWSNRPGQDRGETFTIALLVTLTVTGLSAGWIAQAGGGGLAIALLTVPAFFIVIHALIFVAVVIDWLLNLLGIEIRLLPGHFCGRLFLGLLTAVCAIVLTKPESGCWLCTVAGAWCLVAVVNAAAWVWFLFRDLISELAGRDAP